MNPEWLQFALLIPITFLVGWVRALSARLDRMQGTTYTKEETDKMTQLHLAPMEAKLESLNETTKEIKSMLTEVLKNGQSNR